MPAVASIVVLASNSDNLNYFEIFILSYGLKVIQLVRPQEMVFRVQRSTLCCEKYLIE